MADSYVCSGAKMRCTMGTKEANLTVLPSRMVFLTGQPMANISDHLSMVNLAPFGRCRSLGFPATASATAAAHGKLTPMPCMHNTPVPWIGGKNDYLVKGEPALLRESSKCQCMWGGTISIIDDGQHGEGTQWLQKKGRESMEPTKTEMHQHSEPSSNDISESGSTEYGATNKAYNAPSAWPRRMMAKPGRITAKKSMSKTSVKPETVALVLKEKWYRYSPYDRARIVEIAEELPGNLNLEERVLKAENCRILEKALGIKKGTPMAIEQADEQKANPNKKHKYIPDPNGEKEFEGRKYSLNPEYDVQYTVNCATCAPAYALRLLGFDITAKGNVEGSHSRNEWASWGNSFKLWTNTDGSEAKPVETAQWMRKKKYSKMTPERYEEYFNETCKEEGVYVLTIRWKDTVEYEDRKKVIKEGGGHATILQRDSNGKLYYIEPQTYNANKGVRRPISDLTAYGASSPDAIKGKGIMRVDNKLFNPKYVDLFNT